MKTKDFLKLGKQLLPKMPGFVMEKRVMFRSPVEDFMYGLSFQSSDDAEQFYFSVFFLPLFVPNDSVHGTFGSRLKYDINWNINNPNLMADMKAAVLNEALPFLDSVATLSGALSYFSGRIKSYGPRVNSHTLEAYAYGLIKRGDYSLARKALAELIQMLEGDPVPWVVEQRNRALLIEEKLKQHPEFALAQLDIWKAETVSNLGIAKYCQV
jgi:hypothetical protein